MNTLEGRLKANQTIRDRYGVDENGKSLKRKAAGAQGGKVKVLKGFGVRRDLAVIAGQKGGAISKRKREGL